MCEWVRERERNRVKEIALSTLIGNKLKQNWINQQMRLVFTHRTHQMDTHAPHTVQMYKQGLISKIPICACIFSGLEFRSNSIIYAHAKNESIEFHQKRESEGERGSHFIVFFTVLAISILIFGQLSLSAAFWMSPLPPSPSPLPSPFSSCS